MSIVYETCFTITLLLALVSVTVCTASHFPLNKLRSIKQNNTENVKDYVNDRLPDALKPEAYDIILSISSDGKTFKGSAKIVVQVCKETNEIKLHKGSKLEVKVTQAVKQGTTSIPIENVSYDNKSEIITVVLRSSLISGIEVTINLKFSGDLRDDMIGLYRSTYIDGNGNEKWVAATQFEATHARHAFPCFDEPALKAKFKIMVSKETLPPGYHCLSNMPISDESDEKFAKFEQSVKMSTYLVAFIISDFDAKGNESVKVWTRKELVDQAYYAKDIASQCIHFFNTLLNETYHLNKMDLVAVPDFSAGAMENWGLLTFREANLLYDKEHSTHLAKQRVASVVVHECSHMWFGNLVTPKWWGYLWLSEGFARYYQYMATAKCEEKWQMEKQFVVEQHQSAMASDALEDSKPMTRENLRQAEIVTMGGAITYNKGASILRMIEKAFGPDVFNGAIRSYIKEKKFDNAEPADLWRHLQKSADTIVDENSRVNVAQYMKSWTEEAGFPYVKVDLTPNNMTLTQERFLLTNKVHTDSKTIWSIPITFLSSKSTKSSTKPEFWLTEKSKLIQNNHKDADWLVLNVNSTGFYRVLYDNESWKKIVDVLKSDLTRIPALNRAAIMDDLLNFARTELVSYDVAFNALQYLQEETNYLPFKSAFTSLDYLIKKFSATPDYVLFKEFVISLFSNAYKKLAAEKIEGDQLKTLLYHEFSNRACNLDEPGCIERSKNYFSAWKNERRPVPKNLRSTVYCTAIKNGTDDNWEFLFEEYKKTKVATEQLIILNALGCSRNSGILEKYLVAALNPNFNDSLIRKQDLSSIFKGIYSNLVGAEFMLDFVENKYEEIKKYFKNYNEIGNIVSGVLKNYPIKKFIIRVEKMINSSSTHLDTIIPSLKKSTELANTELKWFNKHSTTIIDWIKKNTDESTHKYRLPLYASVKDYSIKLTPKFEQNFIFDGEVKINVQTTQETNKIVLHADRLTIHKEDVSVFVNEKNYTVKNINCTQKYQFFTIELNNPIPEKAAVKIIIKYTGSLNAEMQGFYRSSYRFENKTRWLASTHMEPVYARRVFPCFDEPALKANFNITVVAPEGYTVISNMGVKNRTNSVWEFETTPKMSTYLVAVVVSDFKQTTHDEKYSVWASSVVSHQTEFSLTSMKPIVENFEKRLGVPYSLNKLDMVALPEFPSAAMENWGLLTYREAYLLYDPKEMSTVENLQSIRNVISHEIAHQWFGNLVSPAWWDYLWLNEGFARYFQAFQYTKDQASWNLEEQFVVYYLHKSLKNDASSNSHPITTKVYNPDQIKGLFDSISYEKAASIIRMLEKLVGSTKFYSALNRYLKNKKYSNAEPSDLFKAFEDEKISNFNVENVMKNWTLQPGFPVVKADVKGNMVHLTQSRFYTRPKSDPSKYESFTYLIPITYATGKNPNFNDTQNVTIWLDNKSKEIEIPNADKDWIIFNVQQMGYYRVNYDEASWRRIFAVLNSDNFIKINEINRAMIIDDLLNLARASQLSYDIVFQGLKYLHRETAYTLWKAAKTGLTYLAYKFEGRPTIYKAYRTYVLDLLKPIFDKLKFNDKKDDRHTDLLLRKLVLDWMTSLDSEVCIKEARRLFDMDSSNSEVHKIPPNQKHFVYCTTIKHGTQGDWDYLKNKFDKSDFAAEKMIILTALGCSRNQTNLKSLLNDVIVENSGIKLQDAKKVFNDVINGGIVGIETTLEFIKENHKRMKKYFGDDSFTKSITSTISTRLTTEKHIEEFENFIKYAIEEMPSISKSLKTSLTKAVHEINWYNEKSLKILNLLDNLVEDNYRLPKNVVPVNYEINLIPYFENFTFGGFTKINISVLEDTPSIVVNTDKLNILNITIDDPQIEVHNFEYHEKVQQLFIYLKKDIQAGATANLIFEYTGVLRDDMRGFHTSNYLDENKKTKWIASTQFEPTFARSAFPCFDEPSFKAKFIIKIAKPKGYRTLSNMGSEPKTVPHDSISERTLDIYPETPVMATYLVAFIVSDFEKEQAKNSNVAVWARKELTHCCTYASTIGDAALKFLEKKLDEKYHLPEMNFVSVPDFDMSGTGNWGLVTFREYGLYYDINKTSATYRRDVNIVVSHELVHMWFGNLVTLEWWDDTWLNKGFAEYLSHVVSNEGEKSWELLNQFVVNDLQIALNVDADESSHPMNNDVLKPMDILAGFDKIAYQKSASVLRMLHYSLGEQMFFEILQNYIKSNKFKNTRSENLIEEFQKEFQKRQESGRIKIMGDGRNLTLTEIINSWVKHAGYPIVNCNRTGISIKFNQERFLVSSKNESFKNHFYWVPITLTTDIENDFMSVKPSFWLGENEIDHVITNNTSTNNTWYIINIQEAGYYRVNYDTENWKQLIQVLNGDDYNKIDELNRAQIIDDSLNLARADYVHYNISLDATKYLAQETNYFSWKAFSNAVAYLSQRIEGQPEVKNLFTKHILSLVTKAYEKLGFKENTETDNHLDQLTRELVLTFACKYGHEDCIKQSKDYFKKNSITPNIALATYCTVIEHGTEDDWNILWNLFESSTLPSDYITILQGLGCSQNSTILIKYLDLALEKNSKIRKQDFVTVVSSIYTSSQIGLKTALTYFKENAKKLYDYYENWDNVGSLFVGLAGYISTDEQVKDFETVVNDEKLTDIKSTLESAVESAKKNLEWSEKYLDVIRAWLVEQYANPSTTTSTSETIPPDSMPPVSSTQSSTEA